jgi:hypothetical protein
MAVSAGKRILVASALLAVTAGARGGDLSPSVPRWNPHFPVFGGGDLLNVFDDDAALTNASAHVAWAVAVPLAGKQIGGRKGLWIAGVSWMALSVVQEALFHAPVHPGSGYPAEVRTDLVTRLVPTAVILLWDAWHAEAAPARPAPPWPPPAHRPPLMAAPAPAAAPTPAVFQWMCLDQPVPPAHSGNRFP